MLRTKPISTLSSCARSFFLSGSRCGTVDGSSLSCTEDEQHLPRKQQANNGFLLPQKASTLVSKASAEAATRIPRDACEVSSFHGIQSDMALSSPVVADQFVKVGIAAAGFLSDLVNYKLPILDGSGISGLSQSYMVNPSTPHNNVRPADVKPAKRESFTKFNRNLSAEPKPANSYGGTRGKGDKSRPVKECNHIPKTGMGNSVEGCGASLDRDNTRRSKPQPSRSSASHLMSNSRTSLQSSDVKASGGVPKGFGKPPSHAKIPERSVESVSRILQQLRWGCETEEALGKLNCPMDAYQANQILKKLQDHSVALGFFYWLKRQPGFRHDEHTYTTMVGILGRSKQFAAINKLLDHMLGDGCQPNVVTYNRLIHSYGRANYLKEALGVFNQMRNVGCAPDHVTYCTLIDIHAKAGFLDAALYIYQKMQQAGLSPDTFTYSVIINCLGKAGHLNAAHKLFCEMVDQGCVPNLVTYNIMIALHAKARNYTSALKLYRDMQSAGFEPDKVTYSIVMEVLGQCGYLEEAEAVFGEMKWKNWVPDELVYGLLVDLWGKAGNVEKAWKWYQAMLNAGLCPNVPTCNSLLSAFLRGHRLSDAYNLLQGMLALGLRPSLQTYTLLLSCCTEAQALPLEMGFCCELMAITGHPAHGFLLSMPAAGPDGQNIRAHMHGFLDLMHSEDRESKRGIVDAVVDFLHKSGLKEEAGSVWEVAAGRNVYPDVLREKSSCYWLINLHVMSEGTAVTALSRILAWLRRQMLVSGIGPSRVDIVTGWGRRSRVTGASLVRQSVHELLRLFGSPFAMENCNSGCFVGCGERLGQWLTESYVERMHLL